MKDLLINITIQKTIQIQLSIGYQGTFALAPIYDMLPMLFAPEHNQVVARTFTAPGPTADTVRAYARARQLAEEYWDQVATDERVSKGFRAIAQECLGSVVRADAHVPEFVAPT
jgi:hypothetical protein